MDVVVVGIPPKFGMLLYRSWDSKLKVTLQMDMSYATIPLFGEHRILYREKRLVYIVRLTNSLDIILTSSMEDEEDPCKD